MKIITNADDCGISKNVNDKIEEYINKGILSSTTIMSNMPFVEDAKRMYDLYKKDISFGIHLNLSEGRPMTRSQVLLDNGFFLEEQGNIIFNTNNKIHNGKFTKEEQEAIFNELSAQIDNILAHGIEYSHIDSHHHIHTRTWMLNILLQLQQKYKFSRIRRLRNYMPFSIQRCKRNGWWYLMKSRTRNLRSTDYFTSFEDIIKQANNGFVINNATIELMTHPGGKDSDTERIIMESIDLGKRFNAEIINYNQI